MAIFDLYSKRQKKLRGEVPDVYTYDEIPQPFRVQVVHICTDTLGKPEDYQYAASVANSYKTIVDALCCEYGVFKLTNEEDYGNRDYLRELANFVLTERNIEKVLDAIELSFRAINTTTRDWWYLRRDYASACADKAIEELNDRFKEHGIGFQFTNDKIIRIDSELIHSEVVKPALVLLHCPEYAGAEAEFLKAHEHYRRGNAKEALNECLKALESTIKAICDKHKWPYAPNATCSKLIDVCFETHLIPDFWASHFSALRSTLECGVPTGRNKLGGHGQGATVVDVPPNIVAYMLHMTAACIVFLAESEKTVA